MIYQVVAIALVSNARLAFNKLRDRPMEIILLMRYWQYGVIGALAVLLALVGFGSYHKSHQITNLRASHELTLITLQADHDAEVRVIERQNFQGVINAVNESTERQKQMATKYDAVVVINDGLSDSIKNIETSLIAANKSAVIDYTKSVHRLLEDSRSKYLEMARAAAREQEEARRLRESWPKY